MHKNTAVKNRYEPFSKFTIPDMSWRSSISIYYIQIDSTQDFIM